MRRITNTIAALAIFTSTLSAAGAGHAEPPRQVWVATVTLMSQFGAPGDRIGETVEERLDRVISRMEEADAYDPDIICLTEIFPHALLRDLPPVPERAEAVPGPIVERIAAFARSRSCYVVCPLLTRRGGKVCNSAVLIDRSGKVAGVYDKIHPTEGEVESGITPGSLDPPVFDTDFGRIGIQICFDANWDDGWRVLAEKGAEIVFWPSAFAGGKLLNALALRHSYNIVACSWIQPARIIDITGDEVAATGRLQAWVATPLNLDREVYHWDFQAEKFNALQRKYGRAIGYRIEHPEGWFVLESLTPEVTLDRVEQEFGLVTFREYMERATGVQDRARE